MNLFKFFKDKNEKLMLIIFILSFILFIVTSSKAPMVSYFHYKWLEILLTSEAIKTISSGVVSAYIFYIFVEIKPKYDKERKTLEVLNQAMASIVEGFFNANIFQHEKSIRHVKFEVKNSSEKIKEAIYNIQNNEVNFLQLKFAMQTAHSRYVDFQNLLALTVILSPKHVLYWLDLTDKVRLLSDVYNNQLDELDINIVSNLKQINSTEVFCSDLKFRVMEFFESVLEWQNLNEIK